MSRLYARSDHFNEYAHPSLPYSPGTDHQIIAPIYPIRRHQERSISDYGEKVTKGKGWFSGARKWIYGVVFLLLVALVIGITVWKVQERKNSGNNSSTSSSPNEVQVEFPCICPLSISDPNSITFSTKSLSAVPPVS